MARLNRKTAWGLLLVAGALLSIGAAELTLRILRPSYRLHYSEMEFNARYHHISGPMERWIQKLFATKDQYRSKRKIAIIGDSFVAGDEVSVKDRFVTRLQEKLGQDVFVIPLGQVSFSPLIYERIFHDVVLPLDLDEVIVCLDHSDGVDDFLYEAERNGQWQDHYQNFSNTVLENFARYPVSSFLLRNFNLAFYVHTLKERLTGTGFRVMQEAFGRESKKMKMQYALTLEPASNAEYYEKSVKYIEAMIGLKPASQRLSFVTFPRAENLRGQTKSNVFETILPTEFGSEVYFEHWVKQSGLDKKHPSIGFFHSAEYFRRKISKGGRQYYFSEGDIHWNPEGHELFAQYLMDNVIVSSSQTLSFHR